MMETRRIVVATYLEPRDTTLAKDGLLTNCYVEDDPEGPMVVKRPGADQLAVLCAGVGQGAIWFNGKALFVTCDSLFVATIQSLRASVTTSACDE